MRAHARTHDRRQRSLDFGSRSAAIPLAGRRADPSPNYHEMARFVRSVRAAGVEPLKQLQAMVTFAITDSQRLANTLITENDFPPDLARLMPPERPQITDEDLPF
jgi:hypothetical protein